MEVCLSVLNYPICRPAAVEVRTMKKSSLAVWSMLLLVAAILPARSQDVASVKDDVLNPILNAAQWGPDAKEVPQPERLPSEYVARLIHNYRAVDSVVTKHPWRELSADQQQVLQNLGLLTLTLAAGKWGVEFLPGENTPADPADQKWRGPTSAMAGKHVMSHSFGGVGLPHLDTGSLAKFIDYVLQNMPTLGPSSEISTMKSLASRFRKGLTFDELRDKGGAEWDLFGRWMRAALLQREGQRQIISAWLSDYWLPSFEAVRQEGGTASEALVLARIWNSAKGAATCALGKAAQVATGKAADRIQAELKAYASGCPRSNQRFIKDRWPWMRRPVVLLGQLP
jgi:hypothetical protein